VILVDEIATTGDIVISTVPSTAQKQIISRLHTNQGNSALLDIAYNPWPSEFARYWTVRQLGPVLSGVEMLLWQACAQVELFTGRAAPVEFMRAALPTEFSTD
jgi:shikimate dehydrogenase